MTKFNDILREYIPDNTVFREDSDLINALKNIIFHKLSETERRILIIYAETRSMYKTGRLLKCSASTVYKNIRIIRDKILLHLQNAYHKSETR